MKKLILKWGAIMGGIMVAVLLIEYMLYPEPDPARFDSSETYRYAAIFASLAIMYMAMVEQDRLSGDTPTTMWQRILLGSGAAVIAGAIFGAYNVFYTEVLNPEFMDVYYDHYISQLPVQSGPEFEQMVADLQAQKEMFQAPATQFLVMAATVIMIGIPMSVALAFVRKLRN